MTDPIRMRAARLLSFLASRAMVPLALALVAMPATAAIDPDDLLPVDDAFALRAEAPSPERIEIRWRIADGYYLYRHRIAVQSDAGFDAQPLQLPRGDQHEDEFFGKVETYRQQLTAVLPGQASARQVTLKIKYQGCADAGICYPPQTRSVTVALPAVATAQADTKPLLNFGPRGNAPLGGGLLGRNADAGADALPLPPEQAFGFEAIAGDGNNALSPSNALAVQGHIALVSRGTCNFTVKARNVQAAGAIGLIVADNVAGPVTGLGGTDPLVTIPAVRISLADGNRLKLKLMKRSRTASGVIGSLGVDTNRLSGADSARRILMYTPTVLEPGSSVSHYTTDAKPNQLMEPSINGDLSHEVHPPQDLTLPLLKDIGW